MPKLNSLGQGVGASSDGVHVGGHLIWSSPSGGATDAGWATNYDVAAQLYDINGARVSSLDAGLEWAEQIVWKNGATFVRAGAGRIAASAAGWVQIEGMANTRYSLCDVSDGGLVVVSPTQSHNSLTVIDAQGVGILIPTGPLIDDATGGPDVRLRGNVLAYRSNSIVLVNVVTGEVIPYVALSAPVNLTVPVNLPDGTLALLELGNGRLTLRPANSTRGIVVADGYTYNPDAVITDEGVFVAAWSTLQGEVPSAYRSISLPVATLFADAIDLNPPKLIIVPPPTTKLRIPTLTPFSRPLSVMITKDLRAETDADTELIVNQMVQSPRPDGSYRACWAASDSPAGVRGHLIGIYGENDDVPVAMAEAESITRGYHVKVMWVSDSKKVRPVPNNLRPGDLVGTEFYLDPDGGDTIEAARPRWQSNLDAYKAQWSGDLVVVLQFYCMGKAAPLEVYPEQLVLDVIKTSCDMLQTEPRVVLLDLFAYDRANGIVAHAGLQEMLRRLLAAVPDPDEEGLPTHSGTTPQELLDDMTPSQSTRLAVAVARVANQLKNLDAAEAWAIQKIEHSIPDLSDARKGYPPTNNQVVNCVVLMSKGVKDEVAADEVWGKVQ